MRVRYCPLFTIFEFMPMTLRFLEYGSKGIVPKAGIEYEKHSRFNILTRRAIVVPINEILIAALVLL